MISRNLIGTGLPPLAAQAIAGTVNDGLTATGTTQATALLISGDLNVFSTVASGTGCILPVGGENDTYSIINDGANALLIYPPVGGTIGGGAVNGGYSLPASSGISFTFSTHLAAIIKPGSSAAGGGGALIVANGKILTIDNTIRLAGTDGTIMTFPSTDATIARTDASNNFTGSQGIGGAASAGTLDVQKTLTGGAFKSGVISRGQVQSDVTSRADNYLSVLSAAAGTYNILVGYQSQQGTISGTVTTQFGFQADSSLTGATNNYGYYANIASGAGRWNFYANGTAANFFNGDMQFSKTVTASGTTGAQTINKTSGSVNFAAAATSLVVTNSLCTTASIIIATVATNDATMTSVRAVAGSGSFTLFSSGAATAETRVNFIITN